MYHTIIITIRSSGWSNSCSQVDSKYHRGKADSWLWWSIPM